METRDEVGLLLALSLPPDPACVSEVRRRLAGALVEAGRDDLTEDACLVTSELVTNALLHAGSEIGVTASYGAGRLRVEVRDGSPHAPRPRRFGEQSRTGRGLHLVESLCDEWGYVQHGSLGKTVWVCWSGTVTGEPPAAHRDGPVAPTARPAPDEDVVAVTLLDFPLLLHAAWNEHVEALLRDRLLAVLGDDVDEMAAVMGHAEVTDALAVLNAHLPSWDLGPGTVLAASVEPQVTAARVVMSVPRRSVGHFAALDRTVEEALELARQGRLLTPPTLPEVWSFRRWVCDQVARQAAGADPEPFVPYVDDRSTLPTDGWDLTDVTESGAGLLAADARSRLLAVSRPAAALLGYADPADLVGSRLIAIIPPRLRQAHVAGMTMYVLADRKPLIDALVTVPALRRDDTEVLVDLLIREHTAADDSRVLVAEISAHVEAGPPGHPTGNPTGDPISPAGHPTCPANTM